MWGRGALCTIASVLRARAAHPSALRCYLEWLSHARCPAWPQPHRAWQDPPLWAVCPAAGRDHTCPRPSSPRPAAPHSLEGPASLGCLIGYITFFALGQSGPLNTATCTASCDGTCKAGTVGLCVGLLVAGLRAPHPLRLPLHLPTFPSRRRPHPLALHAGDTPAGGHGTGAGTEGWGSTRFCSAGGQRDPSTAMHVAAAPPLMQALPRRATSPCLHHLSTAPLVGCTICRLHHLSAAPLVGCGIALPPPPCLHRRSAPRSTGRGTFLSVRPSPPCWLSWASPVCAGGGAAAVGRRRQCGSAVGHRGRRTGRQLRIGAAHQGQWCPAKSSNALNCSVCCEYPTAPQPAGSFLSVCNTFHPCNTTHPLLSSFPPPTLSLPSLPSRLSLAGSYLVYAALNAGAWMFMFRYMVSLACPPDLALERVLARLP